MMLNETPITAKIFGAKRKQPAVNAKKLPRMYTQIALSKKYLRQLLNEINL